MTASPISYREARAWRRPHRWLSLLLYPALLLAPTLVALAGTSGSLSYQVESSLKTAFVLSCAGHILYMCLRSLLSTVTLVATERERGTFDSLATTRTSMREILGTSLVWALGPRFLELALFGPLLLTLPGREPAEEVLGFLAVTVPFILAYGALGLWLSATQRRTVSAAAAGLTILTFNCFGSILLDIVCKDVTGQRGPVIASVIDPIVAALYVLKGGHGPDEAWWMLSAPFHLLVAAALFALTLRRLGRPDVAVAPAAASQRWHVPGLSEDPILYRELLRTSRASLGWILAYPLLVAGPALLVSNRGYSTQHYEQLLLALSLHAMYMALRSISAGSRAVAFEKEQRTWEPLLSTRLSAIQLLRGKALAGLGPILATLAVFSPVWTLYLTVEQTVGMLAYSALLALFLYLLAFWLTLTGRGAALVGVMVAGVLAALTFGPIVLDALNHETTWLLSHLSPVVATALFLEQPSHFYPLLALGPYMVATMALFWAAKLKLPR